jgi:3-methyladenine DNA glycosylase AlkD
MEKQAGFIIEKLRKELEECSDEKTRISGERFFKEDVKLYGIKSAQVTQTGKKYFSLLPDKSKDIVFNLCEELWRSGMMEESWIACNWSYNVRRFFEPEDFLLFERWIIRYVSNWASCDTFCNHTVGSAIEIYPSEISRLIGWTSHPLRWMRRAAAVSLIIPARKGLFLDEIFVIADRLLTDTDDMVRKGYGWMLKSASHSHQQEVFEFVMKNKKVMPRTSLRYAIEKMPVRLKNEAMAK